MRESPATISQPTHPKLPQQWATQREPVHSEFRFFGSGSVMLVRTCLCACTIALACPIAQAADPPPAPDAAMQAVVVKADKLEVETLIDRKVYSVTSDVQSTFGTLSDVLSVIPSVDVDPDGIVSLRGDTNVLILIDGKPSTLFSGPSAGDNLQSIPAKDIERIEILTTPPAQFKADGAAGVINIITRKQRPEGARARSRPAGAAADAGVGADGSYSSAGLTPPPPRDIDRTTGIGSPNRTWWRRIRPAVS